MFDPLLDYVNVLFCVVYHTQKRKYNKGGAKSELIHGCISRRISPADGL